MKRQKRVKNILLVTVGTLILSFGTAIFIIPLGIVLGGVSGLAIALEKILGGAISTEALVAILSWGFFAMGLASFGGSFAAKTLLSTVVYSPAVWLFGLLAEEEVLGGFFYLEQGDGLTLLISAIIGGAVIGGGCALTFLGGGSTGGTDIPALVLARLIRGLKSPAAIFALDALIILFGAVASGGLIVGAVGAVGAFFCSFVMDRIFLRGGRAFAAEIISSRTEEINRRIIEELGRTATVIPARGGFSGEPVGLLFFCFTMREYSTFTSMVREIDPAAFVTVQRAYRISGEGWE